MEKAEIRELDLANKVTEEFLGQVSYESAPSSEEKALVAETCHRATLMVLKHIGNHSVPGPLILLATIEVARELWTRKDAPGGIYTQFADGSPVRLARDPLRPAYLILSPYLPGGFA